MLVTPLLFSVSSPFHSLTQFPFFSFFIIHTTNNSSRKGNTDDSSIKLVNLPSGLIFSRFQTESGSSSDVDKCEAQTEMRRAVEWGGVWGLEFAWTKMVHVMKYNYG